MDTGTGSISRKLLKKFENRPYQYPSKAENQSGKSGLVPEAYVEPLSAAVPSVPNPTPANTMGGFNDDDWGNVFGTATSNTTSSNGKNLSLFAILESLNFNSHLLVVFTVIPSFIELHVS